MYVCLCNAVTDRDIAQAVSGGATDLAGVQAATGASTGCGSCQHITKTVIDQCLSDKLGHAA